MASLGLGIYSLADAALLTRCDGRTIRRWLADQHAAESRTAGEVGLGETTIGFQELLELRVVREFVRWDVPLPMIRRVWAATAAALGARHPFNDREFMVCGPDAFREALCATARSRAHHSERVGTRSFQRIIRSALFAGLEHADGKVTRWHPLPRTRAVIVDPAIQFGQPVLAVSGIPTASLFATYLAEGHRASTVARLFEVSPKQVEWAVRFERNLRAPAQG